MRFAPSFSFHLSLLNKLMNAATRLIGKRNLYPIIFRLMEKVFQSVFK